MVVLSMRPCMLCTVHHRQQLHAASPLMTVQTAERGGADPAGWCASNLGRTACRAAHLLILATRHLLQEVWDALALGQVEAQSLEEAHDLLGGAMVQQVACMQCPTVLKLPRLYPCSSIQVP